METGITFFFDWEVRLIEWIQSWLGSAGTAIASFITLFGEEFMLVAILGFIYWCYDKEFGKFVGFNVFVGLVWNPMLKNIVLRRRPYFDNPGIKCTVLLNALSKSYVVTPSMGVSRYFYDITNSNSRRDN